MTAGGSSNGRISGSEPEDLGSNPSPPATKTCRSGLHHYDAKCRQCPECLRAAQRRYYKTEKYCASQARYRKTDKGRARRRAGDARYRKTDWGRIAHALEVARWTRRTGYTHSETARAAQVRYRKTEKGRAATARSAEKRRVKGPEFWAQVFGAEEVPRAA